MHTGIGINNERRTVDQRRNWNSVERKLNDKSTNKLVSNPVFINSINTVNFESSNIYRTVQRSK